MHGSNQKSSYETIWYEPESIHQESFKRFRMYYSKLVDTPVERGLALSINQCPKIDIEKEPMNNIPYTSAMGSLMHAMLCTRHDIYLVVGLASHY